MPPSSSIQAKNSGHWLVTELALNTLVSERFPSGSKETDSAEKLSIPPPICGRKVGWWIVSLRLVSLSLSLLVTNAEGSLETATLWHTIKLSEQRATTHLFGKVHPASCWGIVRTRAKSAILLCYSRGLHDLGRTNSPCFVSEPGSAGRQERRTKEGPRLFPTGKENPPGAKFWVMVPFPWVWPAPGLTDQPLARERGRMLEVVSATKSLQLCFIPWIMQMPQSSRILCRGLVREKEPPLSVSPSDYMVSGCTTWAVGDSRILGYTGSYG